MFKLIPSLEVLDGLNKEGDEVVSIEYGDELDGEEGEEELEEQILANLTEEQKAEMQKLNMTAAEYIATQQGDDDEEGLDDYGEEGEEEYDEENGEAEVGEKRKREEDSADEGAEKR